MSPFLWLLKWFLKAAIFFILFAFALNNQQATTVHFFLGRSWTTPLVMVVLGAFTAGVAIGVLGMLPGWWRRRGASRQSAKTEASAPATAPVPPTPATPETHGI
jgi:lipopolysaccharide assembly protein A